MSAIDCKTDIMPVCGSQTWHSIIPVCQQILVSKINNAVSRIDFKRSENF